VQAFRLQFLKKTGGCLYSSLRFQYPRENFKRRWASFERLLPPVPRRTSRSRSAGRQPAHLLSGRHRLNQSPETMNLSTERFGRSAWADSGGPAGLRDGSRRRSAGSPESFERTSVCDRGRAAHRTNHGTPLVHRRVCARTCLFRPPPTYQNFLPVLCASAAGWRSGDRVGAHARVATVMRLAHQDS